MTEFLPSRLARACGALTLAAVIAATTAAAPSPADLRTADGPQSVAESTVANVMRFPAQYELGQMTVTPNGATLFQIATPDPAAAPDTQYLIAVDVASGAELWRDQCTACTLVPMPDSSAVVVLSDGKTATKRKASTGAEEGRLESQTPLTVPFVPADGSSLFAGTDGALIQAGLEGSQTTRIMTAAQADDWLAAGDGPTGSAEGAQSATTRADDAPDPLPIAMTPSQAAVVAYDAATEQLLAVSPSTKSIMQGRTVDPQPEGAVPVFVSAPAGVTIARGNLKRTGAVDLFSAATLTQQTAIDFRGATLPVGFNEAQDRLVAMVEHDGRWEVEARLLTDGSPLGSVATDVESSKKVEETPFSAAMGADAVFISDPVTRTVWKVSGGTLFAPVETPQSGSAQSGAAQSGADTAQSDAVDEPSEAISVPRWARLLLGAIVVIGVLGALAAANRRPRQQRR